MATTYVSYRNYNRIRNFGDAVNPLIIGHVSKSLACFDRLAAPHLLPIGSIFHMANRNSHVWGSGVMNPAKEVPAFNPARVHALRGERTVEHLRGLGHVIRDVPLGDPGILVGELGGVQARDPNRSTGVVIVPHHASFNDPRFKSLSQRDDVTLLDMMTDHPSLLDVLRQADIVVSQSLHGLIFAEAFGIPSVWISDKVDDAWCFKFHDWFSTTSNPQREPAPIAVGLDEWVKRAELRGHRIDVNALKAALPADAVRKETDRPLVDYATCVDAGTVTVRASPFEEARALSRIAAGDDAPDLASAVASAVQQATGDRAFPTYVALVPSWSKVSAKSIEGACRQLDETPALSFASIIGESLAREQRRAVERNARLVGDTLVIRPSRGMRPGAAFITLVDQA
jgi:hypothetical protein